MNREELQERLEALNTKAKGNGKPIYFSDDEFEIFTKAYLALDLHKDIFAKLVFADTRAILDNEKKWDWMIKAHEHYQAELQYEQDTLRIEEVERELKKLKERKDNYEKHRRIYGIHAE